MKLQILSLVGVLSLSTALTLSARASEYLPDDISPEELALDIESGKGLTAPESKSLITSVPMDFNDLGGLDLDVLPAASSLNEKTFVPTEADLNRAEIVIVVNKAVSGTTAQKVRIYRGGNEIYRLTVSTGREKWEHAKSGREYFSATPVGYFRPTKLVQNYWSTTWQAWMQNAVFFTSGIALHATAPSHYAELGKRASGGCVRLTLENSETVYDLVKNLGIRSVAAIARDGQPVLDKRGNPVMVNNYDVIVIVYNQQD